MRLQVIALLLAAVACPGSAAAQGRAATWVSVYTASDRLTVVSPQVSVRAPVTGSLEIEGSVDVDVISAASVDVTTAASPRGYEEIRHGYAVGANLRPASGTTVGARYIPSFEPDYESHGGVVSVSREWLDRRLTTELAYRLSFDQVGRSGADRSTWRPLVTNGVSVGLGYALSPRLVGQLAYEIEIHQGFMASPYRYVPVRVAGSDLAVSVPEQVPDSRVRHALGVGLRRAFGGGFFGAGSLRFYLDSWGIASHTEELEVQRAFFGSRLVIGLGARVHGQGRASFHRYRYEAAAGKLPHLRSADKMLSSGWSLLAGPRVEAALGPFGAIEDLRATAKVELYQQRFFEFAPLAERWSAIVSFGIAGELMP